MSEPFRFLDLPVEIRLRIYHYLAPNTPKPPFRDDGRPCCPSILRTNRTIYEEAIVEWYTLMPYQGHSHGTELRFELLKLEVSPGEPLPWMFPAIKVLHFSLYAVAGKKRDPSEIVAHQVLHACFPPRSTGAGNLQRIRVQLAVSWSFFLGYKGQQDKLRAALDANLSAFRNIHGLVEASFVVRFTRLIDRCCPPAHLLWKMELLAISRAFFNDLEQSMTA